MSDDARESAERGSKRGRGARKGGGAEPEAPRWRSALIWAVLIAALGLAMYLGQTSDQLGAEPIAYSELKRRVEAGDVKEVAVGQGSLRATPSDAAKARVGAEGEGKGPPKQWVTGRIPPDEGLLALLDAKGVTYTVKADGCEGGGAMLVWSLPLLLMVLFWGMVLRRSGGLGGPGAQVMTFGKSRHKLYAEEGTGVKFDDVAGVDESKVELAEIVAFLRSPERFHRLGGKIPKGVLLVGPPGTGKTLLAKAVAGEAGVSFYNLSGSDFVEMFVGVGASRVRDLFEQAQRDAPCIVFIDELDAIGKSRGAGAMMGGNDEREQTLNALLVEMDGFSTQSGVILLAATNRPETLDPALLRPGRFDRQVLVDRPGLEGRLAILKIHAAKIVMSGGVDLERVARQTPGFVGADLANIVNEAALLAARQDKDAVEEEDFGEAIERVIAGLEQKNRRLNPKEQRIVAFHEVGHALVAAALEHSDPVQKISIVPRGMGALGYTLQVPLADRYLMTRGELLHKMEGLLGGRGAEELVFGDVSTGAANDLQRVADIARRMVTQYGMSPVLPNVALDDDAGSPFLGRQGPRGGGRGYSEKTAQLVDREVREIIAQRYRHVLAILRANMALLHEVSERLLEREVLEGEALGGFLARVVRVPDASRGVVGASAEAAASSGPGWGVGYATTPGQTLDVTEPDTASLGETRGEEGEA